MNAAARRRVEFNASGSPVKHGTLTGYATSGCRCDECSAASRLYQQQKRASRKGLDAPPGTHGRYVTYITWNCRCTDCKSANAAYARSVYKPVGKPKTPDMDPAEKAEMVRVRRNEMQNIRRAKLPSTRTRPYPRHGTNGGYQQLKCRNNCPEEFTCRMAASKARREQRTRKVIA